MEAIKNNNKISAYAVSVDALGGFDLNVFTDAFYALIERDDIFDTWDSLSDAEKNKVEQLDKILIKKKKFVSKILPAVSSTPQARDEGRWWWFLNEV